MANDNVRSASAVLHTSASGELYTFYYAVGRNWLQRLKPFGPAARITLRHPLTQFFSANERTGTRRSDLLDLYGIDGVEPVIRYVQLSPADVLGEE